MTNDKETAPETPVFEHRTGAVSGSKSQLAACSKTTVPIDAARWNPWEALVMDHREVSCSFDYQLPREILKLSRPSQIWVCKTLNPLEREATLAHELIHVERGIFGLGDPEVRAAEEREVEEITARRLIPLRDLISVVLKHPHSDLDDWAHQLRVDVWLLRVRILTLTDTETIALEQVKGGPLPSPNLLTQYPFRR